MRSGIAVAVLVGLLVSGPGGAQIRTDDSGTWVGSWALDRELSQFPSELGFGAAWLPGGGSGGNGDISGGRGGRGSGGSAAAAFAAPRESEEDARRVELLTSEVRNPPARLTIVASTTAVTITDERGQPRVFHPTGREEVLRIGGVPIAVTTRLEAGRLEMLYKVQPGRELRYTFQRAPGEARLVIDVQFLERGRGDTVRRVYQPADAATPASPPAGAAASAGPPRTAPGGAAAPYQGVAPPAAGVLTQTFDQQPDAELKGLGKLGVVVEELTAQAGACGLSQAPLEAAVSKRLSDAGFTVARNSDEDTYVYVNIITSSVSPGLCVSRYDVFLYTHTTARLSYQDKPVLVQVSLLHKGGITGGAPAAHAAGVLRGVQEYVDQFATRIREANR